jgi:hypothetical protein
VEPWHQISHEVRCILWPPSCDPVGGAIGMPAIFACSQSYGAGRRRSVTKISLDPTTEHAKSVLFCRGVWELPTRTNLPCDFSFCYEHTHFFTEKPFIRSVTFFVPTFGQRNSPSVTTLRPFVPAALAALLSSPVRITPSHPLDREGGCEVSLQRVGSLSGLAL